MFSLKRLIPPTFVLLWATGFIGAGYAMPWAEPFTFLGLRFIIAFLLLLLLVLILREQRATPAQAMHAAIAGALMHGVYLGSAFWAIHHGLPAGMSALVAGIQPLVTAILAGRLLGEKVLPKHWIGLAIGFIGVVIVLSPKLGHAASGVTAATVAASFVAVLGMSAGTIWQKRFAGGGSLLNGALWQYAGASVLMVIASALFETQQITFNGELFFALAWLVLVLSIGAIFLLMVMIRDGEMAKVSSLFYLVPSVTAVMAWALFNETLSPIQILGMAIATAGVWLATGRNKTPKSF
jgi:drug/metabolite transporter (DMT)-like permease